MIFYASTSFWPEGGVVIGASFDEWLYNPEGPSRCLFIRKNMFDSYYCIFIMLLEKFGKTLLKV